MAENINILVYRSTRSNLDIARDKIITELSERGIKVDYYRPTDVIIVYRSDTEFVKIWLTTCGRPKFLRSLRPIPFDYYSTGYSQDGNVDIIKSEFFGAKSRSLGEIIHITADFAVNRTKLKFRFGDHASTLIGTTIDTSIIDDSFTATCTLTDKAVNELIGALTPMPEININLFIKDVIYNDPATIVFWKNGTKTVVKVDGEEYDPEKGLAMAFCKKMFGNKGNYYKVFKKWLPKETEEK